MGHLKKITKVIVNIFTCLLLVLLVLVIYGKVVMTFKNAYPNYFGYTFFEVASGSMEPTLKINDVILVKITNDNLKKGDIIAFLNEETIITHRIIYLDENVITVKGDNNNVVDKPIVKDQVIGKVVKIYPKLGVWKKVITEPKILLAIFITLLLFDFALSYKKDDKKNNKISDKNDDDDLIVKKISNDEVKSSEVKKQKSRDVVESKDLLELTRKIDIEEINRLLEGTEYKLEKKELNSLKKKINDVENIQNKNANNDKNNDEKLDIKKETSNEIKKDDNNSNKNDTISVSEKEKKFIEYTKRLDLSEIQKKINSRVK